MIGGVLTVVLAAGAVALISKLGNAPTNDSAPTPKPPAEAPVMKEEVTTAASTPVQPSAPKTPAVATKPDLSVPYDAAARLAYVEKLKQSANGAAGAFFAEFVIDEKAFASFKVKYEQEAVEKVKSKQKVLVEA